MSALTAAVLIYGASAAASMEKDKFTAAASEVSASHHVSKLELDTELSTINGIEFPEELFQSIQDMKDNTTNTSNSGQLYLFHNGKVCTIAIGTDELKTEVGTENYEACEALTNQLGGVNMTQVAIIMAIVIGGVIVCCLVIAGITMMYRQSPPFQAAPGVPMNRSRTSDTHQSNFLVAIRSRAETLSTKSAETC